MREDLMRHAGYVRAVARAVLRDADRAEDVAQETLLAAEAKADLDPARARGWLGRVAANFARSRRRSETRRQAREAAAGARRAADAVDTVATAERLRWHHAVVDATLALPDPYRTTVLLRFFEGLSPSEIARRTGASPSTVRTRLSRALGLLRDRLEREDPSRWRERTLILGGLGLMTTLTKLTLAVLVLALAGAALAVLIPGAPDGGPASKPEGAVAVGTAPASLPEPEGAGASAAVPAPAAPAPATAATARRRIRLLGPDGGAVAGAAVQVVRAPAPKVVEDEGQWAIRLTGAHLVRVSGRVRAALDVEPAFATTAEDGGFDWPPGKGEPEGDYALVFLRKADDLRSLLCFRAGAPSPDGFVTVRRPGSIRGTVRRPDGTPVKGARVECWPQGLGVDPGDLLQKTGMDHVVTTGAESVHGGLRGAQTDADGSFVLSGLPPGLYRVNGIRDVRVRAGLETEGVTLRAGDPRPPLLEGRVVDDETGGLVPARISCGFTRGKTAIGGGRGPAAVHADGRFLFSGLPEGDYTLVVRAEGYEEARAGPFHLQGSREIRNIEVRLHRHRLK